MKHFTPRLLIDEVWVQLKPGEFYVFMALWNARGGFVSSEELLDACCSRGMDGVVKSHIYHLKRGLERTRFRVRCRKAYGYRLERLPG